MTDFSRRQFGAFLASTLALTALGSAKAMSQAASPVKGGMLRLVSASEPGIQVEIFQNSSSAGVGARVIEGLLTEDIHSEPQPQLAESWQVSPDSKTFTFALRKGVKWHDGQDFTSRDVSFTLWQLKEIHPRRRNTFANLIEIDDSNPHIVVLKFSEPVPYLLPALNAASSPIIARHLYEGTDLKTNPANFAPIGTGPYRFVEWQRGSHTLLERNPEYRDRDYPFFDNVLLRYIPDAGARLAAFEAGELDLGFSTPVPLNEVERLKASGQFEILLRGYDLSGALNQIFFNQRFEPFKDLRVRQAVAHAIDINAFIARVWQGYATPAATIIPPTNAKLHHAGLHHYAYDRAKAEALLDEAGYKRDALGRRFALRLTANPFMQQIGIGAQFLHSALAEIGIEVQLQNFDFATYVQKVYTEGAFDLDIQVLSAGYDPTDGIHRAYLSSSIKEGLAWSNHSHYRSAEADALMHRGAIEPDPEARRQIYLKLQELIHRDLPSVNLVAYQPLTVARKALQDYFIDQQGLASGYPRAWSGDGA